LLLLLPACADAGTAYDYALTWTCLSPDGCERVEEVRLVDRMNVNGDRFYFTSTRDQFGEGAQRVASDLLPPECAWLHSFTLFGRELAPSLICRTAAGFELELSIPNRNPATYSEWVVDARDQGLL
jgi:hypothetical protein